MQLPDTHFNRIISIFEDVLKEEGWRNFSEICGDQTEDFCKEILRKLDEFYGNV